MARRGSVIDERVSFHGLQERRDVGLSDFHLKRGSHAVKRLNALAFKVLGMLMQIDEPGCNNQAFGGNHALAVKSVSRNFLNLALTDADIANGIKASFRIDHAATQNHKIVALRQRQQGHKNDGQTQNETLHSLISRCGCSATDVSTANWPQGKADPDGRQYGIYALRCQEILSGANGMCRSRFRSV